MASLALRLPHRKALCPLRTATKKRPSLSLRGALSATWQSPTLKEEIAALRCAEFTLSSTNVFAMTDMYFKKAVAPVWSAVGRLFMVGLRG